MKPTTDTTNVIDTLDRATAVSMQLESLLAHTYGESRESFGRLNDELQDAYLWLCSELATELKGLVEALSIANCGGRA